MDQNLSMRLCHMKKSHSGTKNGDEQQWYGFNLMSKRDQLCHYVGKVDVNTPAYRSGLRSGDKIIEIDHKNVSKLNYTQMVELLKRGMRVNDNFYNKDELLLLVVDQNTDNYFRIVNMDVTSRNKFIPIQFRTSTIGVDASTNTDDDLIQTVPRIQTIHPDRYRINSQHDEISININLTNDISSSSSSAASTTSSSSSASSCEEIELVTFV